MRFLKINFGFVGLIFIASTGLSFGELLISEFLASNSGASLVDEDAEGSDWVEIHNTGPDEVSLLGYRLTDDSSDTSKWVFPDVNLGADDYLVVFASDKNRQTAGSELHTNFKLSAGGEYLGLYSPAGELLNAFDPSFPEQEEDISYGVGPDGITLGYFTNPSPGSANTISPSGQVADTEFSVQRGIKYVRFTLEITTATPDAQIRYTLDGSTPTATSGLVYTGPFSIINSTVVRAAAFKAGFFPTNVDTQTYLFPFEIRTQNANGAAPAGWPGESINGQVYDFGMDPDITSRYSAQQMVDALTAIPSVALTTDIENLTNASDGIYSNPTTRGLEKPGHLEIIGGPDNLDVSVRCGLRVRGGASRNPSNPKHAFRVFFREEYGDSKFYYPLFGVEGVDEFDKIDFRTAQNYSWSKDGNVNSNTFLREVLARDLQGASGQPYTRSRYYHLYLNGIYWGLFMSQERAEANWGSSYLGGNDDNFDTIKSAGNTDGYRTEATDGTLTGDWLALWNLVQAQVSNPTTARYLQMQGLSPNGERNPALPVLLDVDNLIDYMLVLGYTGSYDSSLSDFVGASNNWFSVRNTARDDRGFVHLMHDAEHSLGAGGRWNGANDRINTTNGSNDWNNFNKSNPQVIHIKLAQSTPEYRLRFADRAHAALFNNGYLTKDRILELLEERRQTVESVIIAESARWGDAKRSDPADKEDWEGAVNSLINLFNTRGDDFLGHLRTGNLYPDVNAPTFSDFSRYVTIGTTIQLGGDAGTLYYTTDGSDPRLANNTANPNATAFNTSSASGNGFGKNSIWSFDDSGVNRGSSSIVQGNGSYDSTNWKHPDFNDSSWSSGPGILGFGNLGNSGAFAPIATSMGQGSTNTGGNSKTSYLRRKFTVPDTSVITALTGSLLADDGVIIYVNGQEVYRQNMPSGNVTFATNATTFVGGGNESSYNSISLDPGALLNGENVVAVELHQVNDSSSDLGFDMELSWVTQATTGVVINEPLTINARILSNGEWSPLTSNYYSTGSSPNLGDLLISEVHYHPANPSTTQELAASDDDSDFEFIELVNISNKQIELKGSALAEQVINDHLEGVRFEFIDGRVLEPGERLVVVSDRNAFIARYPNASSSIGGEFSGNLGNSGEWLRLINREGDILASFRYNDTEPWPLEADGDGLSLQLAALKSDVDYSDPLSWMAITANGSPGASATGPFIGATDADFDSDGISALFEYFSGTDEMDATSVPDFGLTLGTTSDSTGYLYSFTRDPEAFGFDAEIEHSLDLNTWGPPPAGSELLWREVLLDGRLKETYWIHRGETLTEREFMRIQLELTE